MTCRAAPSSYSPRSHRPTGRAAARGQSVPVDAVRSFGNCDATLDVITHTGKEAIMNEDQVKGRMEQAKGSVKEAAGKVVGNKNLEAEGKVDKAVGKVQAGVGDAKERVKDAIKRADDRLSE